MLADPEGGALAGGGGGGGWEAGSEAGLGGDLEGCGGLWDKDLGFFERPLFGDGERFGDAARSGGGAFPGGASLEDDGSPGGANPGGPIWISLRTSLLKASASLFRV